MQILNKWQCSQFELVLFKNDRGRYGIDINNTNEKETAYYYEFKKKREAQMFFETMWRHIFIA